MGTGVEVSPSTGRLASRMEGDVSVYPMPASGIHAPPGGGVEIGPDMAVLHDMNGQATAVILSCGLVVVPRPSEQCANCKGGVHPGHKYCPLCGTKVERGEDAAAETDSAGD